MPEKFKNELFILKCLKCYTASTAHRTNLKPQQSLVLLVLCVNENSDRKSMIILSPSFLKSSVFKMCYVHTKMHSGRFQITPAWSSGFYDGLVCTVDLTVEIKLCFQISPASYFSTSKEYDCCSCVVYLVIPDLSKLKIHRIKRDINSYFLFRVIV